MNMQATVGTVAQGNHDDAAYDGFLARVQARFQANIQNGAAPLFTTNASDLWWAYLQSFSDAGLRQHHNCNACRRFIDCYGSLVTIAEDGRISPAIWNEEDAPDELRPAIAAMAKLVRRADVTGVFLSSQGVWGMPATGVWRHLALRPLAGMLFKRLTQTAGQAMAEKREDFKTVCTALSEFPAEYVTTALRLLKSDALYRSEKVLGQAEWLQSLHVAVNAAHNSARHNVVWLAVARAPAGFCHPRSSMIGTLLEDIAAGMEFGEVSRRFKAKMSPLQYQRPQAAPTAGVIAHAEKIVQQLGAAGSLARRFARVDEIQALWRPVPAKPEPTREGVFGHLKPKGAEVPSMEIPAQTMTWDKLQRTVLPTAERIQILVPDHGPFAALVTAVNAEAPPILQWDREDARNPVSHYVWVRGSDAEEFCLRPRVFTDVAAITLNPSMWNGGQAHQGEGVIFVIDGARETKEGGAAIFPENLRTEFHGVRAVIEAYSRTATIQGLNEPHAAGLMLWKGADTWNATVRVWSGGQRADYRLDRWD